MAAKQELNKLIDQYWGFLDSDWPKVERFKPHRSELKPIKEIGEIKHKVLNRLGVIPIFFFLVVIFGVNDYSGPFRNVEKGILILYHLTHGLSLNDMSRHIPKSSFNDILHDFYHHQLTSLDQRISYYLDKMFSNITIRIHSALDKNPDPFKHITLFLDGHDTRGKQENGGSAEYWSHKLKKSGFRTQVIIDVNKMVLFTSESQPCGISNDGSMFVDMKVENLIDKHDCVAVDGGYTLHINDATENTHLSPMNFCHPVRKRRNIELTEAEKTWNEIFGGFRSKIESVFADLGSTFEKFNNTKYIKTAESTVSLQVFTVQFKLACLLLNVKKFVELLNIQPNNERHAMFLRENFDYSYNDDVIMEEIRQDFNIKMKLEQGQQLRELQRQFLQSSKSNPPSEDTTMDDGQRYEIDRIIKHQGTGPKTLYYVKWKGYGSKDNTWELIVSFEGSNAVQLYWRRVNRSKKSRKRVQEEEEEEEEEAQE